MAAAMAVAAVLPAASAQTCVFLFGLYCKVFLEQKVFFWDDRHFVKEGCPFGFCSGFVPIIFGHAYLNPWTMPGVLPSDLGCIFHKSGGVLALFTYLIVLKLDGTMKKNEASNMQSPHYIRKANSIPDFCWSSIYPTSRDRTSWTSIANNHLKMLDSWAKIHRLIRSTHGSSANSKSKPLVAMWHACRSKSQNKGEWWAQAPTSPVLAMLKGHFRHCTGGDMLMLETCRSEIKQINKLQLFHGFPYAILA